MDGGIIASKIIPGGEGKAGNINITTTGSLSLIRGGQIEASTFGQGDAGNITLNARDTIVFDGTGLLSIALDDFGLLQGDPATPSGAFSSVGQLGLVEQPIGNGGNIEINTGSLFVTNGAQLIAEVSNGRGIAGNIIINARERVVFDGTSQRTANGSFGSSGAYSGLTGKDTVGKGGNIEITTGSLSLSNDAYLLTSTKGQGDAGDVIVRSRDLVSLDNAYITSKVASNAVGKGGNIEITTGSVFATNGGQLIAEVDNGRGIAGNIIINASEGVVFDGRSELSAGGAFNPSGAFSGLVGKNTVGKGGNIEITTSSLSLSNDAYLSTNTQGQGDAGNVIIRARDRVSLDNAGIRSNVASNAVGKGGDVEIQTGSLSLSNDAYLSTSTQGQGDAGNVIIRARDRVSIENASIASNVGANAIGKGGDTQIETDSLTITKGGGIYANTFGQGSAGNIRLQASNSILFEGTNDRDRKPPSIVAASVEAGAVGNAGNIEITTPSLFLANGAQLFSSVKGQGLAGNIRIQAGQVSFTGVGGINNRPSGAFSEVDISAEGNGGNIEITADELSLTNGSQISTSTYARGDAGDIRIGTRQVTLTGTSKGKISGFYTSTGSESTGSGGDIKISTDVLSLSDGATLNAFTSAGGNAGNIFLDVGDSLFVRNGSSINTYTLGQGNAGNIEITTGSLFLTNGVLLAGTAGQGDAGDITIQARNLVSLNGVSASGFPSGVFTNTTARAQGKGGNITISSDAFQVNNGAVVTASTANAKSGGDIRIRANSFSLTNNGRISAQSQETGKAGNITIAARQSLSANNSDITTRAAKSSGGDIRITAKDIRLFSDSDIRTDVASGENQGGNITITADSIIAFDDSDILAFARDGRGGNITFNTSAFFGSGYQAVVQGTNLDSLDGNNRVDVNASGAISSGNISTPDTNSVQNNLSELLQNPIDTNVLLANSCIARSDSKLESSFTITGSGGLRQHPGDAFISYYPTGDVRNVQDHTASRPWQKGDPIVEPQGVYQLPNGKLVLSRECS